MVFLLAGQRPDDERKKRFQTFSPPFLAILMPAPVAASMSACPWLLLVCFLCPERAPAVAGRWRQAVPTLSVGRYINRQDDISTSSSCPDAADPSASMTNPKCHPPSAAGTVLA